MPVDDTSFPPPPESAPPAGTVSANVSFGAACDGDTSPFAGNASVAYGSGTLMVQPDGAQAPQRIPLGSIALADHRGATIRFAVMKEDRNNNLTLDYTCVMTVDTEQNAARLSAYMELAGRHIKPGPLVDQIGFTARLHTATPRSAVTPALLGINVLIFVAMVLSGVSPFSPQNTHLVDWGASFGLRIFDGEWWRVATAMFIHIGLLHIALNMWVLYSIGRLVERVFGNAVFAFVYLAAGVIASLTSLWWNPVVIAAGASGAIFGLIGALLGFAVRQRSSIPATVLKGLRSSTLSFVGYNVVFGLSIPGIDNAAHLGGLFAGAVVGFLAARPLAVDARRATTLTRIPVAVIAAVALAAGGVHLALQSPYRTYVEFTNTLVAEEEPAVRSFNLLMATMDEESLQDETLAQQLEENCLARWQKVAAAAAEVRLPKGSPIADHFRKLRRIARFRVQALEHLIRALREGDVAAFAEYRKLQGQAESTIESMGE